MRFRFIQPRNESGQSLVELALILPFLMVLLFGLIEVAGGINSYLTVTSAAREGARLGARSGTTDLELVDLVIADTQRLRGTIPATCSSSGPGICIDHPTIGGSPAARVKVCYAHQLIVGIPGLFSGPIDMCSTTTMREQTSAIGGSP